MTIDEIFNRLGSFIDGFGRKDKIDVNNAVFIAKRLLNFDIPLGFEDGGGLGIESLELYGMFDEISRRKKEKHEEVYNIGRKLSEFSSKELKLMALYIWNKGRSSLSSEEREKAHHLVRKHFKMNTNS